MQPRRKKFSYNFHIVSYPELVKKQVESFSGKVAHKRFAYVTIRSLRNLELVHKIDICVAPASTTFGWQWPTGEERERGRWEEGEGGGREKEEGEGSHSR